MSVPLERDVNHPPCRFNDEIKATKDRDKATKNIMVNMAI